MHHKSKRFTWEEIAEELQLKVSQLQGLFHHNAKSFTDKHTGLVKLPGKKATRMFTHLGIARFRFLGQAMMKRNAKIAAKTVAIEQATEIKVALAPPTVTGRFLGHDIRDQHCTNCDNWQRSCETGFCAGPQTANTKWTRINRFAAATTLKGITTNAEPKQIVCNSDDEVLDIAVKIVAERQAFNKIKDEIVVLRHENTRMKSLLLEIGALVGDL